MYESFVKPNPQVAHEFVRQFASNLQATQAAAYPFAFGEI